MANAPGTQPRRPKLEVCLERLASCVQQLTTSSQLYQRLKGLLTQAQENAARVTTELVLKLDLGGGLEVPIPMPEDPAQRVALIEEAAAFLGEEVIRLWQTANTITAEAAQHCAAATAAAQSDPPQQSPPQQQAPPQQPAPPT